MRAITHCPACQTQFFVTEEQLNKHDGKVRCGQCMHVFDAKSQFVSITPNATDDPGTLVPPEDNTKSSDIAITPEWPAIHDESLENIELLNQKQQSASEAEQNANDYILDDELNNQTDNIKKIEKPNQLENLSRIESPDTINELSKVSSISNEPEINTHEPSYFDDFVGKTKFNTKRAGKKSRRWPWALGALIFLLLAGAQSIYFLRNEIAIHYPNLKPYLIKACLQLTCSINLPRQIEFIVIDDSDMQEDPDHPGLMHLSSKLINTGTLIQAYPNLELTLTDVDDKPILRRMFKPIEYLPANSDITGGFKAREEIRIKLAITTQDVAVAGYRVFVTY